MHAAFAELFGIDAPQGIGFSGRTDTAILREHIQRAAPGNEHLLPQLQRLACKYARDHEHEFAAYGGAALPGALDALKLFATQDWLIQSVLTGNLRTIGEAKISQIGAGAYVDLELAAYGDEHEVRADLVDASLRAACGKYQRDFSAGQVVLIGDTALDIQAARQPGSRSLGVATGNYTVQQLQQVGADAVFGSLRQAQTMLEFLRA